MTALRGIPGAWMVSLVLGCSSRGAPPPHTTSAPDGQADTRDAGAGAPTDAPSGAGAPADAAGADAVVRFIVGEADAARFYVGHHAAATGYFTPTQAEVAAFERDLPAFLAGAGDPEARAIGGRLAAYRRQFVGVVGEEGRRIFGNYFCDTSLPASAPVMVDDGGSCYFNVFYDPGRLAFARLSVNGDG